MEYLISAFAKQYRNIFRLIRVNPAFLLTLATLYLSMVGALALYQWQKSRTMNLDKELERLNHRVLSLEAERELLIETTKSNRSVDVFKRLSFSEKVPPEDQPKLHVAQTLNTFARYALNSQDLEKARANLEESLRTYPTLEAKYYLGVIEYLQGHNDQALASWTPISNSRGVPNDIYVYLALAEYRAGNVEAAKRYADTYSRTQ